ncbi:MAG TPA: hypothetical protein VFZ22_10105 [Pyrinomonadaceae bacterium]|nr:hypothetical protein [Pyrinomonadaceae bacterium]
MKTRTEITLETERWIAVSRPRKTRWCPSCANYVEMMSIDDAALFAHVTSRTIFRRVEAGALHSIETAEGLLLICPNSPNLTL